MECLVGSGRVGEKCSQKISHSLDFLGKILGTLQGEGECCGKAIGELDLSTLGITTSLP